MTEYPLEDGEPDRTFLGSSPGEERVTANQARMIIADTPAFSVC
jgi:hypothetical protein